MLVVAAAVGDVLQEFPWSWLRDNCQCSQCFEKISKCRIINLTEWEVGCTQGTLDHRWG